ncbi:MAG: hypothetical protein HQ558_06285 [Candidatus Omnitrophica bacterium]|nr:hypothetical protein [Candidatus Omnitrophota bacterium]
MDNKKKLEKIILVVLLAALAFGVLCTQLQKKQAAKKKAEAVQAQQAKKPKKSAKGTKKTAKDSKKAKAKTQAVPYSEIKYEGGAKDPLLNLYAAFKEELKKKREVEEKVKKKKVVKKPLPKLNISGLIWNADMHQAIVNGKVLKVGDSVDGVKIVKIDKEGITVLHQDERVFVPKQAVIAD